MGYTKKKYTKKDIEAMIKDYSVPEGMKTLKQISKETGIKLDTLVKRVECLDLKADGYKGMKERCFNAESIKKILDYGKTPEGYFSCKNVAEMLKISKQSLSYRLKVLKIGKKISRRKLITKEQIEIIRNFKKYKDLNESPKSCCSLKLPGIIYNT